jgi:hypothetical protein
MNLNFSQPVHDDLSRAVFLQGHNNTHTEWLCIPFLSLKTSRVPTMLTLSRQSPRVKAYHRPVIRYHSKNIIPKLKNMSYNIMYSNYSYRNNIHSDLNTRQTFCSHGLCFCNPIIETTLVLACSSVMLSFQATGSTLTETERTDFWEFLTFWNLSGLKE